MKYLTLTVMTLILTACGGGGGGSHDQPPPTPQRTTVTLLGDSLFAQPGWCDTWPDCGIPNGTRIAELLGDGVMVTNSAIPSETSRDRLSRPLPVGQDWVVLRYGVADTAWLGDKYETQRSMRLLIDRLQMVGQQVVVVGVSPMPNHHPQDSDLDLLLRDLGVAFIDVRSVVWDDSDVPDGLHPSMNLADRQNHYIADRLKGLLFP